MIVRRTHRLLGGLALTAGGLLAASAHGQEQTFPWHAPAMTVRTAPHYVVHFAQQPAAARKLLVKTQASSQPAGRWIGLYLEPVDERVRAQLDLKPDVGVSVSEVAPKSPAQAAGLKRFDVLIEADGQPLQKADDLMRRVAETKDKPLTLKLYRGGKTISVEVAPSDRPGESDVLMLEQAPLPEELQEMLKKFGPADAESPFRMRWFGPGVMVAPSRPAQLGLSVALPDGVSLTLSKEDDKPAKITVRRGEETWNTTADKLDVLPEDLREPIARIVQGAAAPRIQFHPTHELPPDFKVRVRPPNVPQPKAESVKSAEPDLKRIHDQLRQMQLQMEAMQRDLKGKPEAKSEAPSEPK